MSGAAASAAIAAQQRMIREEEEIMTQYTKSDLDHGWEFKILRATLGGFKSSATLQQVTEEEARAGWVLVEKFDNYRLRFKRKVSERSKDAQRTLDPYRTMYGASEALWVVLILGGMLLFTIVILAAVSGS